jgi:deferrochelatase/peroxidase EfeB
MRITAFDLVDGAERRDLMRDWSQLAAKLTRRERASRLTLTFGFGPGFFEGVPGLERKRPAALKPLPPFFGDALDPARSNGDLALQACADDADVARAAIVRLTAHVAGAVAPRWTQLGFGRASITTVRERTPRNLMGFKDGTNNITADDAHAMRRYVWVGPRDRPAWLRGGSYLVVRRIRIRLDAWDATPVERQERVIGRRKRSGAPLGGRRERDAVDFDAGVEEGNPVIPTDAHIRLSSPHANGGMQLLRRSYDFSDAPGDEGLIFVAFMRHPRQFVTIQRRLGERDDALGDFISHESSALFACPPGGARGGYVGDGLL